MFENGHNRAEPDTFARCLAGRQLAFLIRQLDYQQLGSILPLALPCVSATVKDQSPAVQCYGLQALQHVATGECNSARTLACLPTGGRSQILPQ